MAINEDVSFIEYPVDQPTQDFVTNFDTIGGTTDVVLITVDGILTDTPESPYTAQQINYTTWRVTPEVQAGQLVRLYRVTDLDDMMYVFTAGAKFIPRNMDSNFKQIRYAQQEVRDQFSKLVVDTNATVTEFTDLVTTIEGEFQVVREDVDAALVIATEAKDTADGIDAKATTALSNSSTALATANAIDAKASTALTNSAAAVTTVNTALSTANTAQSTANATSNLLATKADKDVTYTKAETNNLISSIKDAGVTTWSGQTQEQHNISFPHASDFGLVASDSVDNTEALNDAVDFYNATGNRILLPEANLSYKTTNTNYPDELIRSVFYGGGRVRQTGFTLSDPNRVAVRTTKANDYLYESSAIDPLIDFSVDNTFVINEFSRIGLSPNNAMQGAARDLKTGEYFTYHVSTSYSQELGVEYAVLNRYDGGITTGGVFQSVQSSTPQKITGHQGLSLTYDDNEQRWFFASANASDAKAGAYIIKFKWGSTSNDILETSKIQVFDDSKSTSATTLPSVSPDGRYLAVKRNESPVSSVTGQGAYRVRVFDLPKMLRQNSVDWSNDYLYEFTVDSYDLNGTAYSFQALAVGFGVVTCLFGNSNRDTPAHMITYSMSGRLLSANNNIRIGMAEAHADGPTSAYEPEAVFYSYYLGAPVLYTMVTSGVSGGRIARLFASSAQLKDQFKKQLGIKVGDSINTVDITNNGDFLTGYRRGLKKLQVYTSASQTRITAHTGNLLALAVQDDRDAGNPVAFEWRVQPTTGSFYPNDNLTQSLGEVSRRLTTVHTANVNLNTNLIITSGSGSPEGVVTAGIGSTYHRTDGGAGTSFYVKESGTGNTGWVAK